MSFHTHDETIRWIRILYLFLSVLMIRSSVGEPSEQSAVLLNDDFSGLRTGLMMNAVGAHTEYHYLPYVSQRGHWAVSTFKSYGSQRAWRVIEEENRRVMLQSYENNLRHTHPILIAGDPLWRNYRITADFAPASGKGQSGIVF